MSRTEIKMVLQAETAISLLRSRSSNQFAKTLDYLPGSAVRGAFAEIFLNKRGVDDADFQRIFAKEAVWFSDFLPSFSDAPSFLAPATAAACKRHGAEHEASVRDRLLEAMTRDVSSSEKESPCPDCGEPLERLKAGYFEVNGSRKPVKPHKQLRMHVGISRATGSALHSLLFSYEMLVEEKLGEKKVEEPMPLKFVGTLAAKDESDLAALEKVVPDREHLSVGHARTRGLGELAIEQRTTLARANDLDARCLAFNQAVHARGGDANTFYFTITLNSHLALRDRLGLPVLAGLNGRHFGLDVDEMMPKDRLDLIQSFLSTAVVPGWNAALGMPKPDTHAISRGSVVVFSLPKTAVTSKLMDRLGELECKGIGERRAEGFGSLTVCHPIHYEFAAK